MVKGWPLWGMVLFCVLSGNGWILTQAWPSQLAWPFIACIHFAWIGGVGLGFAAIKNGHRKSIPQRMSALCGAGLCIFVLPTAALEFASGSVSEATSAAAFCAVPLMTVLAASAFGGDESRVRSSMVPALIGLAGAALLFPVSNPGSLRRWLSFGIIVATCAVVAIASVELHRLLQSIEIATAVTIIGLGSSAVLGLYGASEGWPAISIRQIATELLRCVALDLPAVFLLTWLIREIPPSRLSARFLFVPLVTVLEGFATAPRTLEWRSALAIGLLCVGGLTLLQKEVSEELPSLHLH